MYKFVWKIENFSYLKGEPFLSPYLIDLRNLGQCHLLITQRHSEILACVPQLKNESIVHLYCSVSFLNSDGTPLIYKVCKMMPVKMSQNTFFPTKMDTLMFPNDTKYFPNNILRVECCIWCESRTHQFPPISFSNYAFTRVESNIKRITKTFRPQISGFRAMNSAFVLNEAIWNEQSFEVKIDFPSAEQALVRLSTTSLFGFHAKIKVSVVDTSGKMIEFGNHDALFTSTERSSAFKLNASKAMFLRFEDKFLPSDTLSLVINCTFSGHFAIDRMVEESEIFNDSTTNNASGDAEAPETEADETDTDSYESETSQEIETSPPNTIVQTLQDILKKGYLSDVNLKVGDKVFPVHKNILGARSKFFEAMFDSEMKETQVNWVDIKDVDADTLQRMLQFIYTDRIVEFLVDWADASSLYAAADFYALEPLKQGCSEILKNGLCVKSALGVLHLADLHQDRQLKSAALDFISLNDKDIIGTEDWIKFLKDNGNLALETLGELYSRKMNG